MLVTMATLISSHVKDKNSIFEDMIFLVKGKILVFHQFLYNKNIFLIIASLRKQLTFRETTSDFTLMTCHEPDLVGASDWLKQISHAARPISCTSLMWVVRRHISMESLYSFLRRQLAGKLLVTSRNKGGFLTLGYELVDL